MLAHGMLMAAANKMMPGHRAYRVYVVANGGHAFLIIGDISLNNKYGQKIQTINGSAISSSYYSGFPASNAFDGSLDYNKSWASDGSALPQWCGWDFGINNIVDVYSVTITNSNDSSRTNRYPVSGFIQHSDNGIDWVNGASFSERSISAGFAGTYIIG